MKVNASYLKIFTDLLIPILGFLWWNWSIYFILLFLLLDLAVSEVLVNLKTKKIKSYSEKVVVKQWVTFGVYSFLLFIISSVAIHIGMKQIRFDINFTDEIYNFLSYKEMGVAQGIVLIPLVVLMGYSQYKTEFLIPQLFRGISFEKLWKNHFIVHFSLFGFILLMGFLAAVTNFNEWVYLGIMLLSILTYKLLLLRKSLN
jgi:hypothetical protein